MALAGETIQKLARQLAANRLVRCYRQAVGHRARRKNIPEPPVHLVQEVAARLGDARLADLFIEAQFNAMPAEWCVATFKTPVPPANTVFGGEAWRRYQEYLSEGVRSPVW